MTHPTHRGGECHVCEGEGRESADCEHSEGHDKMERPWLPCPDCPECQTCDGTGEPAWAWEPDTRHDECAHCGAEDVDTMPSGEDGDDGPVCLACVTRWHATACGCDQWPKVPEESDEPGE